MDQNVRNELLQTLEGWIEQLPEPDIAIFGFADGGKKLYTPREILAEIKKQTPLGNDLANNFLKLLYK